MTADTNEANIVQIIPATGWYAILDEGTAEEWKYPLVCWALTSAGEVVGQIATELGVESAETAGKFSRYWHEKTLPLRPTPPTAEDLAAEQRKYAQMMQD